MSKKNKKFKTENTHTDAAKENVSQLAALAAESRAFFESKVEEFTAEEAAETDAEVIAETFDLEEELEVGSPSDFSEEELFSLQENQEPALEELAASPTEAELLPVQEIENVEDTELAQYESAAIEQLDFVEDEKIESIIESILFSTDRPISLNSLKMAFKGTQVTTDKIRKTLDRLSVEYAGARRGISLDEVPGGYQLRTKLDNLDFLRRTIKARPFKLSGPALEVLAIAAYKQPLVKNEIDQIRGVESGHLLRALMERGLVQFEGKSELPGRPMYYGTTKKFLEIFGLRNLKELPTLSQIDELLPEGMDEEEAEKPKLSQITDSMSESVLQGAYSQGEEELEKIQSQLAEIDTTSDFFEKEKQRQKDERDRERAQSIREALSLAEITNEIIPDKDLRWLKKYDEGLAAQMNASLQPTPETVTDEMSAKSQTPGDEDLSTEATQEESSLFEDEDSLVELEFIEDLEESEETATTTAEQDPEPVV